jgi:hypothetical protein
MKKYLLICYLIFLPSPGMSQEELANAFCPNGWTYTGGQCSLLYLRYAECPAGYQMKYASSEGGINACSRIAPQSVDNSRYILCMNDGLGQGRPYATPEQYCQQWAGPAR